jgi:hypothetical protein
VSEVASLPEPGEPSRKKPRKRTLGAAMLAGAMVGLQEVLEGPKEEPVILETGSGAGNEDDPLALDLDPYDPAASIAVVRPWLQK